MFYEYTLKRTKALKKIKQNIEDETPVTQEEARNIREDIDRLREARDEALNKLRKKEEEYKTKLDNKLGPLQNDLANAKQGIKKLTSEKQDINHQLSQSNDFLSKKNDEYTELRKQIEKPQDMTAQVVDTAVEERPSKEKENDATKVLRFFYESNYKPKSESALLDAIVKYTKLARPKAKKIVHKLLEDDIIQLEGAYDDISISDKGNKQLLHQFDLEDKNA
ncbi:MAG: hypothetical protein COA39_012420 [Sulfurimonas sp.]|nr:hypothetical protein [Sulfurimonas sp.]